MKIIIVTVIISPWNNYFYFYFVLVLVLVYTSFMILVVVIVILHESFLVLIFYYILYRMPMNPPRRLNLGYSDTL